MKGDAYEGLLEKNAQDVKGGAGQYFTPRALIQAHGGLRRSPRRARRSCDPACGTGGFLLAAHDYVASHYRTSTATRSATCSFDALRGVEMVHGVARLCAMNLFLHGIGPTTTAGAADPRRRRAARRARRALRRGADQSALRQEVVASPSSNEEGETDRETLTYKRRRLLGHDLEQAAQLRPARQDAAQDPRPRRRGRARQRALRGRRRRDRPPQAPARVRRPHPAAPADRHLLRAGRQGERALLRPQARRAGRRGRRSSGSTTCAPTSTSRSRPTRSSAKTWTSSFGFTIRPIGTIVRPPGALPLPPYPGPLPRAERGSIPWSVASMGDGGLTNTTN